MRMRLRSSARMIALAGVIAVGAVACGGGGSSSSTTSAGGGASGSPKAGGTAILGAEQWPQCLNPITDCAAASWWAWTIQVYALPRLGQWTLDVQQENSDLTTEVPSVDNGGITQDPFTVTWKLNPAAVWSDGTPITCDDVDFTWKAINNTTGAYGTVGYTTAGGAAGVEKVECPDPQTVKLDFNKVFVDWFDLFGGTFGFVLEKAAFPTADPDKPNLKSEMNDSLPFSGGPWVIKSWSQDQEIMVPNDKYWGQKPYLTQVTFVPREDQATEVSSMLSGDVDAVFPQPSNVPFQDNFRQNPDIMAVGGDGNYVENLWINTTKAPLNDPTVRQAFAYAMNREAVIKGVIGLNNPSATVNDCGMWIPGQGPWCADPLPWAQYTYDPDKAGQLLTQAGYKQNADTGFYEKNGQPLTITVSTTAGNVRRATTVSLLQQGALAAGINLQIKTYVATDLFSNVAPKGDFQVCLFAQGAIIDPSVTATFSSDQIPTAANGYGPANWTHFSNKQADTLMAQSDQELDVTKRADLIHQIGNILAAPENLPIVPIDVLPNIAAWNTKKLAGVDPASVSSPYGFFFGVTQWYAP